MKVAIILLCMVALAGCAAPRPQNHVVNECGGKTKKELVEVVAAILTAEGFDIQIANETIGIVQASKSTTSWGTTTAVRWKVQCANNSIRANACLAIVSSTVSPSSANANNCTPLGDDTSKDWAGYWEFRKKIEEVCGSKIVIEIEKEG